jgi:hypothetical protein
MYELVYKNRQAQQHEACARTVLETSFLAHVCGNNVLRYSEWPQTNVIRYRLDCLQQECDGTCSLGIMLAMVGDA